MAVLASFGPSLELLDLALNSGFSKVDCPFVFSSFAWFGVFEVFGISLIFAWTSFLGFLSSLTWAAWSLFGFGGGEVALGCVFGFLTNLSNFDYWPFWGFLSILVLDLVNYLTSTDFADSIYFSVDFESLFLPLATAYGVAVLEPPFLTLSPISAFLSISRGFWD